MRKYRGLTKEGKWVYGWYCQIEKRHFIIPDDAGVVTYTLVPNDEQIYGFVEVLPETVGQSTSKHDRKRTKEYPEGQEIYGGDIIQTKIETEGAVVQFGEYRVCTDGWGVAHTSVGWFFEWSDKSGTCSLDGDCEVIGNVHQPELLEQGNG